ncbi:MAG: DNA polymerase subunit beta, partial [Candidatus Spyradocola sp.]
MSEKDPRTSSLLDAIARACADTLGENLVGVYVHGSLAFGCFTWDRSDVDFLVVAREDLAHEDKMRLISALMALWPLCPPKGLEMSVALRRDLDPFAYPTPFVLHLSGAHLAACRADLAGYCRRMNGVDPDLAAHVTVLRQVGYAL